MAEGRTAFAVAEDDWYVEPTAATEFLLKRESFAGLRILDPACGQGNIVRTCRAAGLNAVGSDLRERDGARAESWFLGAQDWLTADHLHGDAIIMNPPYGRALLAEAFIRRALSRPCSEKVAAFVNAKFLFGAGRAKGLFAEHPPSRVWPVVPRPSCPPGQFLLDGGKAQGGVENYVWMVWDVGGCGRTWFRWQMETEWRGLEGDLFGPLNASPAPREAK